MMNLIHVRRTVGGGLSRSRTRPQISMVAALLLAALTLAACGDSDSGGGAGEGADGPITIKVGYIENPSILPILVAKEQGFFEDDDITIEEVPFDNGADVGAALAGGSLDVGYVGGALPVFTSRGAGTAFHIALLEKDTVKIYGDPSITDVADLKGKTVATTVGTTAHVTLYYALKAAGLDLSDIDLVNADQAGAVSAFVSKQVDAIAVFPPNTLVVEDKRSDASVLATAGDFYPENSVFVGFVANNNFAKDHRPALVRFTEAMIKANDYLNDNESDARAAAYEAMFKDTLDETAYNAILDGFSPQTSQDWGDQFSDGSVNESLTRLEKVFVTIGGLDSFVDPEKWFDPSIYAEALKEVGP